MRAAMLPSLARTRLSSRILLSIRHSTTTTTPSSSSSTSSSPISSSSTTPSTSTSHAPEHKHRPKKEQVIKSSCEAGTVLKGLNIRKTGSDPVALPEDQYPPFLWKLLNTSDIGERKEARKANRAQIKRKNFFSGKL